MALPWGVVVVGHAIRILLSLEQIEDEKGNERSGSTSQVEQNGGEEAPHKVG